MELNSESREEEIANAIKYKEYEKLFGKEFVNLNEGKLR